MNNVLFSNENYNVQLNEAGDAYELINSKTNVVESFGQCLPALIGEAEHNNTYLVHEMWKWISKQAEEQSEMLGGSGAALLN